MLLGGLILGGGGNRGGTLGFHTGVSPWGYFLAQGPGIFTYLRLSLWPHPLIFDYGMRGLGTDAWPEIAAVLLPLGATAVAFVRWPKWGFLGLWFFGILAPTSLMPGFRQTLAEHRMYLPLAAVLAAAVFGVQPAAGRWGLAGCAAVAAVWLGLTVRRNEDYRSNLVLWRDTVGKIPANPYARSNYGKYLAEAGRLPDAVSQYEAAVALEPGLFEARDNLGNALSDLGRPAEAAVQYAEAVRLSPRYARAQYDYGTLLAGQGQLDEALVHFESAVRLEPGVAEARSDLGGVLLQLGRTGEAIVQFNAALLLNPRLAGAHFNLGNALLREERYPEAASHFEKALQIDPAMSPAKERLEYSRRLADGSAPR